MTQQQTILMGMFKWFHNFCVEKNLRYYMVGGTMLGAIRHKGFIPWDDDIDVGMPREDYEKFIQYSDKIMDHYIIETPNSKEKKYTWLWSKIYDVNTTFTEKKRNPIRRGFYIDVFPIDGMGNSMQEAGAIFKKVQKLRNRYLMLTCEYESDRVWWKNLAIAVGRTMFFYVNVNKLKNKITDKFKEVDYDSSSIVGNLGGRWGAKEIMKKTVFGTPKLYHYEDTQFYGVEDYDTYLSTLYGDYMTPPPEDKRNSKHYYLECDENKPFMDLEKTN